MSSFAYKTAMAMLIGFIAAGCSDGDDELERKYEELLQKCNALSKETSPKDSHFTTLTNDVSWQSNGVFTLKDIKFYNVTEKCFHDKYDLEDFYPSKTFQPNDCLCLKDPNSIERGHGELVVFTFRNIKYFVFVNNCFGYNIAGGRVARLEMSNHLPYLGQMTVQHNADFWWSNYYAKNIYVSKMKMSPLEWFSVERDDHNKCIIRFHATTAEGDSK